MERSGGGDLKSMSGLLELDEEEEEMLREIREERLRGTCSTVTNTNSLGSSATTARKTTGPTTTATNNMANMFQTMTSSSAMVIAPSVKPPSLVVNARHKSNSIELLCKCIYVLFLNVLEMFLLYQEEMCGRFVLVSSDDDDGVVTGDMKVQMKARQLISG